MSATYGCLKSTFRPRETLIFKSVELNWHLVVPQDASFVQLFVKSMRNRTPNHPKYAAPDALEPAGTDILELLRADPGRFTLGELLQQRDVALHEITRLRANCRQESQEPTICANAASTGRDQSCIPLPGVD